MKLNRRNKRFAASLLLICCAMVANAKVYYLSPDGNNANDGLSLATAWGTPDKVANTLVAGDTCWTKGGTYTVSATVKVKNDGTKEQPICWFAVRGELPVFDCSSFRNYGSENSKYRGMDVRKPYWHVRGLKIYKAGHNGFIVSGPNIIIEGCIVEECGHDGISIGAGAENVLILNCDSYRNADISNKGENGDGFAAKEGKGTVFRGCRAWENVDDGWDVYGGSEPVLIDSCWSMANGTNYWPEHIPAANFSGDGNGFKLGGGGGVDGNAPNVVVHSFAVANVSKGFDQNHNAWGVTCINCTGYGNHGLGNFAFAEVPSKGVHVMKNNLSYAGTGQNIAASSIEVTNSWNLGLTFTDDMFESVDWESVAKLPRDADYRLTDPRILNLFKLKNTNPAIDKGTVQDFIRLKPDYAIPYFGTAPDLGARELEVGEQTQPELGEEDPAENPETPITADCEEFVNEAAEFVVTKNTSSKVWGPFALAKSCTATFDMLSVGSSNASAIIEFSADNTTWTQVGSQAKNGSTGSFKPQAIDLGGAGAPSGKTIYIRIRNNSGNDVKVKNLVITGVELGETTSITLPEIAAKSILSETYYNLQGQRVAENASGLLIKQTRYTDGSVNTSKIMKRP